MKSHNPTLRRKLLSWALSLTLSSCHLLVASSAMAKTGAKLMGELSFARQVTVNGTGVISGITIYSDSRVKTSQLGAATVNLDRLGRIGLGSDTDLLLRFSEGMIGGNLISGRVTVNAAPGVKISIVTADGVATSEGKQGAVLTVDVTGGNTRVASSLGEARVTSGNKVEKVEAGDEVSVSGKTPSQGSRRGRTIAIGALGAGGGLSALALGAFGSTSRSLGFTSATATVFPNASSGPSSAPDAFGDPPCRDFFGNSPFNNRLVCRDYFNTHCLAQPSRRGVCNPFR